MTTTDTVENVSPPSRKPPCSRGPCVSESPLSWGLYHGGRRPSSDDSLHSPTVIPPSALEKPSIMKRYHRRRRVRVIVPPSHCVPVPLCPRPIVPPSHCVPVPSCPWTVKIFYDLERKCQISAFWEVFSKRLPVYLFCFVFFVFFTVI